MRKWLILALLFGFIVSPSHAGAQGGIKLDLMSIELWPEYDRPSMLVIKQFILSEETSLPAAVTLRFPTEGNLVAVAVESNGGLFNKDFSGPAEQGDWQAITINVDSYEPHRIEYYQPLTRNGDTRQFQYQWFGDYYVEEFSISILVPADSRQLTTDPVLQNTTTTQDGSAISGAVTKSDLKMGNSFRFELEYERASDTLTDPNQSNQIQPSDPVNENTPGRVSITNLPLIIGAFGLALIGIALFSYWRSTQTIESKPRKRRRSASSDTGDQAYCHECGTRASPGDRFCRTCGSRLRTD
ncbi:MAG TPA: zinc ribbon domain-containing protein [Anaerolineales bacterium]|nr:zinc ribbon domain-containing protein [Anaerolineales bacterium]